jgi:hypothetical protein
LPKEQCQVGVEDVALMVLFPKKLKGYKLIVESLGRSLRRKYDTICK